MKSIHNIRASFLFIDQFAECIHMFRVKNDLQTSSARGNFLTIYEAIYVSFRVYFGELFILSR